MPSCGQYSSSIHTKKPLESIGNPSIDKVMGLHAMQKDIKVGFLGSRGSQALLKSNVFEEVLIDAISINSEGSVS